MIFSNIYMYFASTNMIMLVLNKSSAEKLLLDSLSSFERIECIFSNVVTVKFSFIVTKSI